MREEEKLRNMVEKLRDCRLQIIVRLNLILRYQLPLAGLLKWMLIIDYYSRDQQCSLLFRVEQLRAEAITGRLETLAGFDSIRGELATAVSNLERLPKPGSDSAGSDPPIQESAASLGPVRELISGLQSRASEIQVQHQILRRLACASVYHREESITDASGSTFDWMFCGNTNAQDAPDGLTPDRKPMPQDFGLPVEATYPGRSRAWLGDEREAEKLRSYVREQFKWWLAYGSHIFHFSGKAGSGKSTLMKYLWSHPLTKQTLHAWAHPKQIVMGRFYFWAASNDPGLTTLDGLYRSILFEVLGQCPDLISKVFPRQWKVLSGHANPEASFVLAQEMFRESDMVKAFDLLIEVSSSEDRQFCFFIDGLDEFAGDLLRHRDLVQRLLGWVKSKHVKLCTSSRPEPEKLEMLSAPPNCLISLHEMTKIDIQLFCQTMLERDRNFDYIKDGCQGLVRQIVERANGVFLWVHLIIRLLLESAAQQDSLEILYAKLESVPLELNDLIFQRLLKPLNSVDELRRKRMLYFALTAGGSPSVHAFSWLDEVHRPDFPYSLDIRSWSDDRVKSHAKRASALLQYLTKGLLGTVAISGAYPLGPSGYHASPSASLSSPYTAVQFLHRSAYDFLVEPERRAQLSKSFSSLGRPFEEVKFRLMVADLMVLERVSKSATLFHNMTSLLFANRHHDFPPEELDRLFGILPNASGKDRPSIFSQIPSGAAEDTRQAASLPHLAAFCGQSRYISRETERPTFCQTHSKTIDVNILLSTFLADSTTVTTTTTTTAKVKTISLLLQTGAASATQRIRLFTETDSSFAPGASRQYPSFEPRDLVPVWMPIALRMAHFVLHRYFEIPPEKAADTMRAFGLILRAAPPGMGEECLVELVYRRHGDVDDNGDGVGFDVDAAKVVAACCPLGVFVRSPDCLDAFAEGVTVATALGSRPGTEQELPLRELKVGSDQRSFAGGREVLSWSAIWNYDRQDGSDFEVRSLVWQGIRVEVGQYLRVY
jgi:hypothetical protein